MVICVAVCTTSQPENVANVLQSITAAARAHRDVPLEALFVYNGRQEFDKGRLRSQLLTVVSPHEGSDTGLWQVVSSRKLSLSAARNMALKTAKSDWVAFVDDDAAVPIDYFDKLCVALENSKQHGAPLLGGRVLLEFDAAELRDATARIFLSELDHGESRLLDYEFVNGANFACRRDIALRLGGFPESLGRQAGSLISGEESYLQIMCRKSGYGIWYDSDLVVTHHVPVERCSHEYLVRRLAWEGVTQAVIGSLQDQEPSTVDLSPAKADFDYIAIKQTVEALLNGREAHPSSISGLRRVVRKLIGRQATSK